MRMTARDFRQYGYPGGPVDFQGPATPTNIAKATEAVVERKLGVDQKPVLRLSHPGVPGFVINSSFREWFQTVEGVNKEEHLCQMVEDSRTGTLVFDNKDFFLLDGFGFQDERPNAEGTFHNYYFTMEMHQNFTYHGGEMFSVTGEDDLWVFINGTLAIDFGGIHGPLRPCSSTT